MSSGGGLNHLWRCLFDWKANPTTPLDYWIICRNTKLCTLGAFKANSLRMTVSKSSFFTMVAARKVGCERFSAECIVETC